MNLRVPRLLLSQAARYWLGWIVGITVVGLAIVLHEWWLPATNNWVEQTIGSFRSSSEQDDADGHETDNGDPHAGHDHSGHAHDEATSLELSGTALRNLGLTPEFIQPVTISTFRRSITVPALVVERPGRTRIQVAAPMTGVVTHVHSVPGEAIKPSTLLFRIRLTHEDLVKAQTDFLRTLGELDVERREIRRLQTVTKSGAIAGKVLLEREYARDKLQAVLSAEKEALRLHGLSTEQVEQIVTERRLLRDLQVFAPSPDSHGESEFKLSRQPIQRTAFQLDPQHMPASPKFRVMILSDLHAHKGQSVEAGETLCVLSDYSELYIEGLAFEQDASEIATAAKNKWRVSAVFERPGRKAESIDGLEIVRLANEVDTDSRTLKFYVRLPNSIQNDTTDSAGHRYVDWQHRPGKRLQLRVPIEDWPDQIVLPVDAVTKEGAEYYVFQQNGDHFDRVGVHVKYRDQQSVVIANDGSLFPGDIVALRGAHQMQMALKNKAGGGVDPHAGHNH